MTIELAKLKQKIRVKRTHQVADPTLTGVSLGNHLVYDPYSYTHQLTTVLFVSVNISKVYTTTT